MCFNVAFSEQSFTKEDFAQVLSWKVSLFVFAKQLKVQYKLHKLYQQALSTSLNHVFEHSQFTCHSLRGLCITLRVFNFQEIHLVCKTMRKADTMHSGTIKCCEILRCWQEECYEEKGSKMSTLERDNALFPCFSFHFMHFRSKSFHKLSRNCFFTFLSKNMQIVL